MLFNRFLNPPQEERMSFDRYSYDTHFNRYKNYYSLLFYTVIILIIVL